MQKIAENLTALGLTQVEIANIFGVTASTIKYAKGKSEDMKEACKKGKEKLHDMLVAQMVLAASGYDYTEKVVHRDANNKVTKKIESVRHIPASPPMMMFLMTNQFPDGTPMFPKGWRIKRELLERKNINLRITGKMEKEKIKEFAGKLAKVVESKVIEPVKVK